MLRCSCYVIVAAGLVLGSAAGCNQKAEAASGAGQPSPTQTASAAAPKQSASRLVFLDKEEACECTQAKIDAGWTVVQAALSSGNPIPVERIHMDTQEREAAPLIAKRAVVALPALYVLDAGGNVIELFQGDMDEASVRKALQ